MANNYTDLKNNYMYGQKNRLNNYYQNYKNFTNDLEDPIFTGFTFYINMIQSPLFNSEKSYSSESSGGVNVKNLASKIENSLKKKHDSRNNNGYETSITNIEKFDSSNKIGYGNQEKVRSEGFSYNAIEYIYMVDKLSHGGNLKMSFNGLSDISDETLIKSVGTKAERQIAKSAKKTSKAADSFLSKYEKADTDEKREKLEQQRQEYIRKNESYVTSQMNKFDNAKEKCDVAKEEYEKKLDEISKLKQEIEEINKEISYSNDVEKYIKTAYESLIMYIEDELGLYKKGPLATANVYRNKLNEYHNKFKDTGKFTYKFGISNNNIPESAYKEILADLTKHFTNNKVDLTNKPIDISWLKNSDISSTIELAYAVFDNDNKNALTLIEEKKYKLNGLLIELYGKDSSGKPLSQDKSSDNSLHGKYRSAVDEVREIRNSPEMNDLAALSMEIDQTMTEYDDNLYLANAPYTENYDTPEQREAVSESRYNMNTMSNVSSRAEKAPQTCIDLVTFINGMKRLTEHYPYIFQTVVGLDDAYNNYFKMDEPYQGSGENKITINCYESIDMRVSSLFNKYFNAAYDREYKRERLPVNLRRFNCSIFVHDIRNFRHALNLLFKKNGNFNEDNDNVNQSMITELALNHLSVVEFKFFDCEILQEDTGNIFDTINNADLGDQRMTTFSFKYGNCFINFLPFNDLINYYKTSGGNNDNLADESKIVSATRRINEDGTVDYSTENTQQISDFTEREEIINESKVEEEYINDYDFGNVNDNQEQTGFVDSIGKITDEQQVYGESIYLGNVQDDDFFEYENLLNNTQETIGSYINRRIADELSMRSADELYFENKRALDITMRSLSASTGYSTNKIYSMMGLGNVYKKFREEDINTPASSDDITSNEDKESIIKGETTIKSIPNSQELTGDYVSTEDNIKEVGLNYNNSVLESGSDRVVTSDNITMSYPRAEYIGELKNNTNYTTSEKINKEISDTNNKLFGDVAINGINDRVHQTSRTDYIKSEDINQIGIVKEIVNDSEIVDSIERDDETEINETYVDKIGSLYETTDEQIQTTKSLGSTIFNTKELDVVRDIDVEDKFEPELQYTKEIGKLKFDTSNDGIYKSKETIYKKDKSSHKDVGEIGNIGNKINVKDQDDLGSLNFNTSKSDDIKSIESEKEDVKITEEYKSKNKDGYVENVEYKDLTKIGNVNTRKIKSKDIDFIGNLYKHKQEMLETYKSKKNVIDINESKPITNIGNVYNKEDLNNLNDLTFD